MKLGAFDIGQYFLHQATWQ